MKFRLRHYSDGYYVLQYKDGWFWKDVLKCVDYYESRELNDYDQPFLVKGKEQCEAALANASEAWLLEHDKREKAKWEACKERMRERESGLADFIYKE